MSANITRWIARLLAVVIALWTVSFPEQAAAQTIGYGDTFHAIDRTVDYVTSWYAGAKVTSIRRADGAVDTVLEDGAGNVLASAQRRSDVLDVQVPDGGRLQRYSARLSAGLALGTDWYNEQLYVLWSDRQQGYGASAEETPRWTRGHLRLAPTAAAEASPDVPLAVRTQFVDSFAYSELAHHPDRKKGVSYPLYTTRFFDADGSEIGLMKYYDDPMALSWSFDNGNEGVAPEWRIPSGFTFEPTMAWAGI